MQQIRMCQCCVSVFLSAVNGTLWGDESLRTERPAAGDICLFGSGVIKRESPLYFIKISGQ